MYRPVDAQGTLILHDDALFDLSPHTHSHTLTKKSRLKKSNKMQQYADIYLLLNYSTCFGRPSRPSSGVHKTVVTASGTGKTNWDASFFKRDQIRAYLVTFEEVCSPDSMICTRGCNYSFMHGTTNIKQKIWLLQNKYRPTNYYVNLRLLPRTRLTGTNTTNYPKAQHPADNEIIFMARQP